MTTTLRPIALTPEEVLTILKSRETTLTRPARLSDGKFVKWPCDGQPNPNSHCDYEPGRGEYHIHYENGFHHANVACPWGRCNDELWGRETFRPWGWDDLRGRAECFITYRVDSTEATKKMPLEYLERWTAQLEGEGEGWWDRWRPSTQMPEWASRIRLRVLRSRPELQDHQWVWAISVRRIRA